MSLVKCNKNVNIVWIFLVSLLIFARLIYTIEVRYYGQECTNDEECPDYRQWCEPSGHDDVKRCYCDGIHRWEKSLNACVLLFNSTFLLTLIQPRRDMETMIANEAIRRYVGPAIAGWFVVSSVVFLVIGVLLFCKHVRKTDRELKLNVEKLKTDAEARKPTKRK